MFWLAILILALNFERLVTDEGWDRLLSNGKREILAVTLKALQSFWVQMPAIFVFGIGLGIWKKKKKNELRSSEYKSVKSADFLPTESNRKIEDLQSQNAILQEKLAKFEQENSARTSESVQKWETLSDIASKAMEFSKGTHLESHARSISEDPMSVHKYFATLIVKDFDVYGCIPSSTHHVKINRDRTELRRDPETGHLHGYDIFSEKKAYVDLVLRSEDQQSVLDTMQRYIEICPAVQ